MLRVECGAPDRLPRNDPSSRRPSSSSEFPATNKRKREGEGAIVTAARIQRAIVSAARAQRAPPLILAKTAVARAALGWIPPFAPKLFPTPRAALFLFIMASSGATGDALFAGLTVRVDLQGQMMQQQIVKGKICKLGGKIAKEGERADVVCLSDSATASDAAAAALLGAQVLKRKWVEDSVRDNKLADRAPYLLGADPAPSTLGKRASDGPAGAGAAARESGGGAEAKKPRVDAFSHMMGASKNKALDLNRCVRLPRHAWPVGFRVSRFAIRVEG